MHTHIAAQIRRMACRYIFGVMIGIDDAALYSFEIWEGDQYYRLSYAIGGRGWRKFVHDEILTSPQHNPTIGGCVPMLRRIPGMPL
jgi:hypothetical protein